MQADADQFQLCRYLEHYNRLSSWTARKAKATDISLSQLNIEADGKTYRIPLDPPMGTLRDARARFVQMDEISLKGLSRSDIKVTEYELPRGFQWVVFNAVVLTLLAYCKRSNFLPGSWLHDNLLQSLPGFVRFSYNIQPLVFYGMLLIHATEAGWLAASKLPKHSVPMLGSLWWKWIASTFIDGVCSFQR